MAGEAPTSLWVLAGQHADDVRAVLDGSWRDFHGEASEAFVLRNLAPWSANATFVKEVPEKAANEGNSFQNKAVNGFLCGYLPDGHRIRVGYYLYGRVKVTETRNFKIHGTMYFKDPIPGARDVAFVGPVPAVSTRINMRVQNTTTGEELEFKVFQCGDCGLYRAVSEYEAIEEIIREYGDMPTCADAGMRCHEGACAIGGNEEIMKRYMSEGIVILPREQTVQMSRTITRKEAMLPENLDKTMAAIKKEQTKYENFRAYGDEVYEWDDIIEKCPKALRVWLGLIYVWKFLEDEDKKTIAARLCAFGNAVINAHGLVVDGFREDEISWASTPTPSGIKIQLGASKLKGQDVSFDDYRGAYLQAPLEENAPDIYCTLPKEMQSEEEKKMKNPVRKVNKALAVRPYEGRGRLRPVREEGGGEARVEIPEAGRPPGLCHSPPLE